jgi:hypothetical protein
MLAGDAEAQQHVLRTQQKCRMQSGCECGDLQIHTGFVRLQSDARARALASHYLDHTMRLLQKHKAQRDK